MLKFFFAFLNRFGKVYKKRIYALFALSIITGTLELGGIALIFPLIALVNDHSIIETNIYLKKIYTLFSFSSPQSMIYFVAGAVGATFVLKNIYMVFYQYLQLSVIKRWRDDICNHIMQKYMNASYTYHLEHSTTGMVNSLEFTVYFVLNSFVISFIVMGSNMVVALMLIGYVIIKFPLPTLISGAVLAVLLSIQLKMIRRYSSKIADRVVQSKAANLSVLTQGLVAIKETKSFMKEGYFTTKYAQTNAEVSEQDKRALFMQYVPTYLNEIIFVTTIIVMCCLVLSGNTGIVSIANLAILAAVSFRLAPLANRAFYAFSQTQVSAAAAKKLMADMVELDGVQIEILPTSGSPLRFEDSIAFRNVSFSYASGEQALNDIDLTIKKGEFIGIVGPSGAGKTTLVDVVLGLLELSSGEIYVDGLHLENERLPELRHIAGYVSQSPYIFNGTIRENVAFGVSTDTVDDTQVSAALRDASLDDFFRGKDKYLDEIIADNGKSLSGGQRQRIAIARALYKNPEIIILDEATSALDTETEHEITNAINRLKGKKTILAIAHRLSTLKGCDRILYMSNARIVDSGTFAELNERHPDFARMLKLSSVH